MSKFGLQIRDQTTFIISLRTWERFVSLDDNLATSFRPNEGDLIYFPLSGSMFEIKFVEHEDPFYQVGKLFVFKLKCELFEYSQEDFDTGIGDIDLIEDEQAYTTVMTMGSGNGQNYVVNENITKGGTVVGEVVTWNNITSKLTVKDVTTTLAVNDVLVGATSTAQYTITSIDDRMVFSNDASAQNKDFEDQDSNYLDLSEVNHLENHNVWTYFYNETIKRCVSVFGTLFNNVDVKKIKSGNTVVSQFRVPISYDL